MGLGNRTAYNYTRMAWYHFAYFLTYFALALGFPPLLDQTLGYKKHGEVMKILDILRLLSGNPAKSRLLWLLFSWLSSRAFCKPGLWIWENALWPFLWPQSNPLRQVISLPLPKGKNQGPGKLPRISQPQMLAHSWAALGHPTACCLLALDVLWLLWEGPVSSLSPHFHGLLVLPQEGRRPILENHHYLELQKLFSTEF